MTTGHADRPTRRVLLLTSHPVDGRDGADKEIPILLAQGLPGIEFTYFGRFRRAPQAPGRVIHLASRTGWPGLPERAQVVLRTPMLARSVDLVHAVMTIGSRYAAWSRSRLAPSGRPVVLTVPGVVSPECVRDSRPLGVTVALSSVTADLLRDAGYPDVRVIPPGIDVDRWSEAARQPKPRPVIFFAGHTDEQGGAREAIEVAARVQHAGQPVRLVLGLRIRPWQEEAAQLRSAAEVAAAAGLDEVEVHGRIESMQAVLAAADVVLFLPDRLDGGKADIPLVILEALATGRPAVVTGLPQLRALRNVVHQVPVGALDEAAAVVRRLLADPGQWHTSARSGRAAVIADFSAERMCRDYGRLYAELLKDPRLADEPA